jgi:hypothetical protein
VPILPNVNSNSSTNTQQLTNHGNTLIRPLSVEANHKSHNNNNNNSNNNNNIGYGSINKLNEFKSQFSTQSQNSIESNGSKKPKSFLSENKLNNSLNINEPNSEEYGLSVTKIESKDGEKANSNANNTNNHNNGNSSAKSSYQIPNTKRKVSKIGHNFRITLNNDAILNLKNQ